jgi:prepilin-type N-terminal cleavage/methylation domain-containing protein
MRKLIKIIKSEKGFTLLEVIITLVIAAILGSLLFTFMGTAITRSSDPIFQAQNTALAKTKMEELVAAYTIHLGIGDYGSWSNFISVCAPYTPVTYNNFLGSVFAAVEVTITEGDQTYVAYFTQ